MPNFGERLRKQRIALGLSQQAFADACSIWLSEQRSYEEGRRGPNAEYLDALCRTKVDLPYLLSGEPSRPMPEGISRGEWTLLDNFHHSSPEAQLEVEAFLAEQARLNPGPQPPSARPALQAQIIDLASARRERTKS